MPLTQQLITDYLKARRALIANDFAALNPMQQQAVMTTEGPLLLLAGAGSGKTTVLINRIANLIRYGRGSDTEYVPESATEADIALLRQALTPDASPEQIEEARQLAAVDPCPPWRIIAITFTNKAADELKARLARMLGTAGADVWAMTFHSACVRILRREATLLGYPLGFTIYDTADSQSVVKHIIKDLNLDEKMFPYRTILAEISRAKDAQITPELYLEQAKQYNDVRRKKIGLVYQEYMQRLQAAGAMDFDDLISNTVQLFQTFPETRAKYQEKFRYVLIDEYQDTNNLQYLLASLLAGGRENICVVGDDDQSIYKFRGATIENILNFENQYPDARTIRLEQNYRSKGHILHASNAVISNNTGRKGKNLWTQDDDGERLQVYRARNENDEAQHMAELLLESYSRGEPWHSNAILYRMNAQSNQLEYACKKNGIPYRILGGTRFFERAEIKDMLAYLCVLQNPEDDLRLLRIINVPARGIGQKTVEAIVSLAQTEKQSVYQIIDHAHHYPTLQRSAAKLCAVADLLRELREFSMEHEAEAVYSELLERTGYVHMLEEKQSDENLSRIENVQELKSNIIQFAKDSGDSRLETFLDQVALYTDLDSYDRDADCVVMMTMHSAKGLEFDNVYLVGMEEGIFPGLRAIGEREEMEEERRLCYVGMTRAKKRLFLSCARQRMLFGRTSANQISRFVEEIPMEDMEQTEAAPSFSFAQQDNRFHGQTARYTMSGTYEYHDNSNSGRIRQSNASKRVCNAPKLQFQVGDHVKHKVFGSGVIQNCKPMGGDALLEISFDNAGTKRLMQRAAAQHMTKE